MPSVTRRSADTTAQNVTSRQATTRSAAGESVVLGAGARDRLLQAQENRARRQNEAIDKPAPTYYDGQGRVKPLGANNGIRARGIQSNAALGVGDRVSDNGGLIAATPRTPADPRQAVKPLEERVNKHAQILATLQPTLRTGTGDPNTETTPGTQDEQPRFVGDHFYDTDSGTLFLWNDGTGEWDALQQLWQGFTGTPAATVFVDGAIAINDSGTVYTGTISGGWVGTTEDIDIVIDTGNGTYPLITSSSIAYTVRAINSSGTGTGTLSPTIDADIAIGGSLNLTLSGNDDSRWSATIRLQRKA